ncbi:MAG: cupin domain-containing protein [Kiritimatiellae bacterium]|nr:cupin domain-containing protein [Kiritimatiellia bacterium]MCO5062774.1 cupin domain-containing protein [Kiritimatiellia bacterium]MCO6401498.1 cupin domain-containing protein [Verrucomicrobiota bacterium]
MKSKASRLWTSLILLACGGIAHAESDSKEEQVIYRFDPAAATKGAGEYFTGDVQVDRLFPTNASAAYSGAYVTFQAGARTAWHLHPAGQHMIVTAGTALVGTRDGKVVRLEVGDSLWCPPDLDHWHGATADAPMTHLVITGSKDGQNAVWKEQVTETQTQGQP